MPNRLFLRRASLLLLFSVLLGGCVYRVDVQQGNLLDESAIESM